MTRTKLAQRVLPSYTKGEEIFNMTSHIVGGALSIVALVLCIIFAALRHNTYGVIASAIYGSCMIAVYVLSSVYHGLKPSMGKKVMQVIDHCGIYFMIAGSYMPVVLCSIRVQSTALCWIIFGIEWALVAFATTLTAIDLKKYKVFSMVCYIGMGWLIILFVKPLYLSIGFNGVALFVLGGILYTIGAVIYSLKRIYAHSIFHIFIVLGSIAHFFAIILYVL